jgi:hypothetical protein
MAAAAARGEEPALIPCQVLWRGTYLGLGTVTCLYRRPLGHVRIKSCTGFNVSIHRLYGIQHVIEKSPIQYLTAQSLLLLGSWELWRERNRHIFQKEELSVVALVRRIRDEASLWRMAGASFPFDPG